VSVERLHLRIEGLVQGVGYRAAAAETASRLLLVGWVRNLPDGAVEALAEGPRAALEAFANWCAQGPSEARVVRVLPTWQPARSEHARFEVTR
jgi:acylphosphatase